jgi:hypothetical protein
MGATSGSGWLFQVNIDLALPSSAEAEACLLQLFLHWFKVRKSVTGRGSVHCIVDLLKGINS